MPLPGAGGSVTFLRFDDGIETKPPSYESKQETPQNSLGLHSPRLRGSPTASIAPSTLIPRLC